jgi:transcriptional regulator with XRE-family HTH domain
MATHEEIGITVRTARLEKSMSLGQLASAVGRSSSSVRRWERGEVAPAASIVPKLAAILDVDPEDLHFDPQSNTPDPDVAVGKAEGEPGRVSTVEQPVVIDTASSVNPPDTPIQPSSSSGVGVVAKFRASLGSGGQGWAGWLRGFLTLAVLAVMLFALLWAVGELFTAVESVLDSFDVGSNGG